MTIPQRGARLLPRRFFRGASTHAPSEISVLRSRRCLDIVPFSILRFLALITVRSSWKRTSRCLCAVPPVWRANVPPCPPVPLLYRPAAPLERGRKTIDLRFRNLEGGGSEINIKICIEARPPRIRN